MKKRNDDMKFQPETLVIFNCNAPEKYCLISVTGYHGIFSHHEYLGIKEQIGAGPYMAFFSDDCENYIYRLVGPYIGKEGCRYFSVNLQNVRMDKVVTAIRTEIGEI